MVTEPGEVKPTFLPASDFTPCSGEPILAIQPISRTLRTPAPMITIGCPAFSACTAAANDTSPNGRSPASVLRTEVPPPVLVRMPVMSSPRDLKKPLSIATA